MRQTYGTENENSVEKFLWGWGRLIIISFHVTPKKGPVTHAAPHVVPHVKEPFEGNFLQTILTLTSIFWFSFHTKELRLFSSKKDFVSLQHKTSVFVQFVIITNKIVLHYNTPAFLMSLVGLVY